VLLPNSQDGVPYLTTQPIAPHSSFIYHYKIIHSGTYWYHSHTNLQEQRGVYGSLVFHPKHGEHIKTTRDYVVVMSDWNDENPKQTLENLKRDGDYYALKKGSVQSWAGVLRHGPKAIINRLKGSWRRMEPMDLSDVGYDAFLINGKQSSSLKAVKGDTVRLRLINAAASSYFNVEFAGGPMTVVSADGVNVEPIKVKRLRMAIAETYDVIVPISSKKSYELRASSEDGTGHSSIFIGQGPHVVAPTIPKPNIYLMDHTMHTYHGKSHAKNKHTTHQPQHGKQHHAPIKIYANTNHYQHLRALHNTAFPNDKPLREVTLDLTGNMERYVWSFNNKTLGEADKILIKKGETVRFFLRNKTMMHHPIHLHGHFFRVLNGQGKRSPLKHTVNVPPMNSVVIEFDADKEKDWFFHCHNLYHMISGMARIVSYKGSTTATEATIDKLAHNIWFFSNNISVLSNMSMGMVRASNTRNAFELEFEYNYDKKYDADVLYAWTPSRFLDLYAGGEFERDAADEKPKSTAIFGIRYLLPMLIESNLRFKSKGKAELILSSTLQLTDRTQFEWSYGTNKEYHFDFGVELTKEVLLAATYDSDFKWGLGLRLKF